MPTDETWENDSITSPDEKPVAYRTANAVCLACGAEWCACEQVDWATLPCPACWQNTGRWVGLDCNPILMKTETVDDEVPAYYDPPDWEAGNDREMLACLDRLIAAQPGEPPA